MSAPKKPDYAGLWKVIPEVTWAVQGRQQRFEGLLDRAEWLEAERDRLMGRAPKPMGGKEFKGPDPKVKPRK